MLRGFICQIDKISLDYFLSKYVIKQLTAFLCTLYIQPEAKLIFGRFVADRGTVGKKKDGNTARLDSVILVPLQARTIAVRYSRAVRDDKKGTG